MKDQAEDSAQLLPGLYVVATPIGNLEDLTFRGLRVLKKTTWVAAEDTRETLKLLNFYGIQTKLRSFHEHSTLDRVEELVNDLKNGGTGAYVSDAGTPGICDPGAALVNACIASSIPVYPIPGASAPVAILSVAGFLEPGFGFHGFFPREKKDRETWAQRVESLGGNQVLFESPHRIVSALKFLGERFPQTNLVVGREITKRFETITRGTCEEVWKALEHEEPRGEYVLALSLPEAEFNPAKNTESIREIVKELAELGAGQKVLVKAAISHGMSKNEAYRLALEVLEK